MAMLVPRAFGNHLFLGIKRLELHALNLKLGTIESKDTKCDVSSPIMGVRIGSSCIIAK